MFTRALRSASAPRRTPSTTRSRGRARGAGRRPWQASRRGRRPRRRRRGRSTRGRARRRPCRSLCEPSRCSRGLGLCLLASVYRPLVHDFVARALEAVPRGRYLLRLLWKTREMHTKHLQTSSFITRSSRGRVAPASQERVAAAAAAAAARPRAPRRRTGTPSRAADQPSRAAARTGRAAAAGAPPSCPRGLRAAAPRRTRRAREFAAAGA